MQLAGRRIGRLQLQHTLSAVIPCVPTDAAKQRETEAGAVAAHNLGCTSLAVPFCTKYFAVASYGTFIEVSIQLVSVQIFEITMFLEVPHLALAEKVMTPTAPLLQCISWPCRSTGEAGMRLYSIVR
jgi:hypothetical protein